MKLVVFSHKECWRSKESPTGWATDGGFIFHMQALSSGFDHVYLIVPEIFQTRTTGEILFQDEHIQIIPLSKPWGKGVLRKLFFPLWFLFHLPKCLYYTLKADVVHTPIPGDIGTIGMVLAPLLRKKLFVRYCGNWQQIKTSAENFWRWYGEQFAGKSIAYLCTGGDVSNPSSKNPALKWVFSSSMTRQELTSFSQKNFDFDKELVLTMGGRIVPEKGFREFVQAAAELQISPALLKINIFGEGLDLSYLKELSKKLGIEPQITFTGKLNSQEVHEILSKTDIFCFPTYSSEGFPKAVIEAMAHGIPVISTHTSVIPQLINQSTQPAGLLVNKRDPSDLAKKIEYYYQHPSEHLTHAQNARMISGQYSLENWVDEIFKVLNQQWKTNLRRERNILK